MYHDLKKRKKIKQQKLSLTLVLIGTVINNWVPMIIDYEALVKNSRMISEGSCETED